MGITQLPALEIRPLDGVEVDQAADFLARQFRDVYQSELPRSLVVQRGTAYYREYLSDRRARVIVAWYGPRPVGLASCQHNCIDDLWVARRYRRRGIGRRLLQASIAALREQGYQFAQAGCEDFNEQARHFFEHAGWDKIGSEPVSIVPGRQIDALVFSRRIDHD
jgi:GNAT superfamily N-acetyltransferase